MAAMSLRDLVVTRVALPLTGRKRRWSSAARARASIESRRLRPESYAPPKRLGRRAAIVRRDHGEWPVYELTPTDGTRPRRAVVFLHGGGYVNEIAGQHWSLAGELVRAGAVRVVVPIYPLGSRAGATRVVAAAADLVAAVMDEAGDAEVVVMGDSAGGGLALATAQALRNRGRSPRRLVLISPWLDVRTSDPASREIEPRDRMLGVPGLLEAATDWAGDLPLDDPRVSPLLGSLAGLPPITVLTGTNDLLHPDSTRLRTLAADAGIEVEWIEGTGQQHDWPLFPTPEGRAARTQIVRAATR